MIDFQKHTLNNGLRVIIHEDKSTPLSAINLLYDVGAKDDPVQSTGFAHLFEHLMFSGSKNAPDFDTLIQTAGGDSNAFTNSDVTNFYETIPADNLEVALWLEADRMVNLNINERSLEVQRKVVVEEFNETCLNIPYGKAWHELLALAYKKHTYRWPTIGLVPQHIQEAQLDTVTRFYKKHYAPNNAVLVVAGNVDTSQVLAWVQQYFGAIPKANIAPRNLPQEEPQTEQRRASVQSDVPLDALYMAFHTVPRTHPDYYAVDLLSDILCNGKSSRLYKQVKKQQKLFGDIDAYVTGNFDAGMIVIEGQLSETKTLAEAEKAVWEVIANIRQGDVREEELQKYKNKAISGLIFNECSLMSRATHLALFEVQGDANIINKEPAHYEKVTLEDIQRVASQFLVKENSSVLEYRKS